MLSYISAGIYGVISDIHFGVYNNTIKLYCTSVYFELDCFAISSNIYKGIKFKPKVYNFLSWASFQTFIIYNVQVAHC